MTCQIKYSNIKKQRSEMYYTERTLLFCDVVSYFDGQYMRVLGVASSKGETLGAVHLSSYFKKLSPFLNQVSGAAAVMYIMYIYDIARDI